MLLEGDRSDATQGQWTWNLSGKSPVERKRRVYNVTEQALWRSALQSSEAISELVPAILELTRKGPRVIATKSSHCRESIPIEECARRNQARPGYWTLLAERFEWKC
jgi:hypothetical protein